ncbi:MAG TPA: DUF2846 domain-containing protein, partial [Pyrinomonadaceae bacterium]|nr:DUF2846 domain-containing protein [Pyrinomonadaceae bacterium]
MKLRAHLAALALLVLLAPAAARGQEPTASPSPSPAADAATQPAAADKQKATVYIYRTKKFVGSALEPSVFVDGVELGRMDNGRYLMLRLDPGEHRFHMTEDYKRVDEKLRPGQVLYIRFRIEAGAMKGRGALYLTDEEDAVKELKKLKPLGADKIKDKTMIVEAKEAEAETKR